MKTGKYFDHILGDQISLKDIEAEKALEDYIQNHKENQSEKNIMDRLKIGLQIEMWEYLNAESSSTIPTGEFLNRLLRIYNITKTKFANFIQLERTNLQAVIKGNRKFNSLLAKKIEKIFDIPAELWLHIETKNDLANFDEKKLKTKIGFNLEKLMHTR